MATAFRPTSASVSFAPGRAREFPDRLASPANHVPSTGRAPLAGRARLALSAAALAVLCLAGLAGTARADDKPRVVTTFTILADMARNVAGDAAEVVSVTKPGAEIHGYQPTPKDIGRTRGADLILWNGLNLELWFEKFLQRLDGVPSATLSPTASNRSRSAGASTTASPTRTPG